MNNFQDIQPKQIPKPRKLSPNQLPEKKSPKSFLYFILELLKIVVISLLIIVPLRYFLFQPFIVRGDSMEPNFQDGEYLIIDEITYDISKPKRGDVIVFRFPGDTSQFYIKRIIGLPSETIEIESGRIIIYNEAEKNGVQIDEDNYLGMDIDTPGNMRVELANDQYFVLGDNRHASSDSRGWGPLNKDYIVGKSWLRAFPFDRMIKFNTPTYDFISN